MTPIEVKIKAALRYRKDFVFDNSKAFTYSITGIKNVKYICELAPKSERRTVIFSIVIDSKKSKNKVENASKTFLNK